MKPHTRAAIITTAVLGPIAAWSIAAGPASATGDGHHKPRPCASPSATVTSSAPAADPSPVQSSSGNVGALNGIQIGGGIGQHHGGPGKGHGRPWKPCRPSTTPSSGVPSEEPSETPSEVPSSGVPTDVPSGEPSSPPASEEPTAEPSESQEPSEEPSTPTTIGPPPGNSGIGSPVSNDLPLTGAPVALIGGGGVLLVGVGVAALLVMRRRRTQFES